MSTIGKITSRQTTRRTSKADMVDVYYYTPDGKGPYILATYVQRDLAEEIAVAIELKNGVTHEK